MRSDLTSDEVKNNSPNSKLKVVILAGKYTCDFVYSQDNSKNAMIIINLETFQTDVSDTDNQPKWAEFECGDVTF